jgi:hypothetical protein
MIFNDFTYTTIAPGTLPANLTMLNSPQGGSTISMGEGVRDTYGSDYFTAGPKFTADVILAAPLSVNLGLAAGNGANSSMLFSGQITNPLPNPITYTGAGTGTSLWISSANVFNGNLLNPITIASGGGGGGNGYTLHLVDSGRLDGTPINPTPIILASTSSYLGLQDNRNGGPISVGSNLYLNSVNSYGGNVYADRSYQLNPLDTTINVEQYVAGGVKVYQVAATTIGVANFGSTGPFGRTNNGYNIHLESLTWDTEPDSVTINVNNGNLTEGRGGSRYVSGANRLQEPNNYTYVSNLWENSSKLVPFIKGGNGILVIDQANGVGQWWTLPQVNAGVLRLGYPTTPQNAPSVILNTANAGVGIGWDTRIDLNGIWGLGVLPFPITPAGAVIGQSGAVDIDKRNFATDIVDPNVQATYLRIGSSMDDDASFDPWPIWQKHASVSVGTQIIPYFVQPGVCYIYYFGGGTDTTFWTPIKINTSGTPNTQKNCGSVIDVDAGVTATLKANFDFSAAPAGYLEKDGLGTLIYDAPAPAGGAANTWGLKLTEGLVQVNQMPVNVNPGADTGPVIFNGGNLYVVPVPAGMALDRNATYGFSNIVSFQYTTSQVTIADGAMFRVHGSVPSEILGSVFFYANDLDNNPSNNVVHLSRNGSPGGAAGPGYNTHGNGQIGFMGVTVYMSGGGAGNNLNVLPQEEGFVLQLGDGVVFNASRQNTINGTVYFVNNNPATPVKIDGEEAIPSTPNPAPPFNYPFTLVPETWTIAGTGLTSWTGTIEKVGPGTVAIKRSLSAPVTVVPANLPLTPPPLLKISGGTFEAGGSADPFTDNTLNPGLSMSIVNDSTATGLLISQGIKNVNQITGVSNTTVSGPAGTELIATSIVQNTLTIGAGCTVMIRAIPGGPSASSASLTPVPEPATWILLALAAVGLLGWLTRTRRYKSGS